ncbi:MAG: diguanylate cyclase [Candidatus Omnitrophota bacterium]
MKAKVSLVNLSLRRRVYIAIALVSLLPLIVLFYHLSGYYISLWTTLIIAAVIVLGWWIIFEVFDTIIKVYNQSRNALEDIGEKTPSVPDEVASLEKIIGLLSDRVKSGFEQLRDFTQMTEDLNKEVSRTVLILSTILQANDLFSKEAPAESVIKLIINHLKHLIRAEVCFCGLEDKARGKLETVARVGIDSLRVESLFKKRIGELTQIKGTIVVDSRNKPKGYSQWAQELEVKNIAIAPIVIKERTIGVIGIGNNADEFFFSKDDLEVLGLFSQNVTLIWQHERLSAKVEDLEIIDYLTGLYNEKLIIKRLDEEIKRSTLYQRPCGFIAVQIANYDDYRAKQGLIAAEGVLKKMGKVFKETLGSVDIAGRIGPGTLGAILIESNKRQSQEITNNLKENLKQLCGSEIKLNFSVAESPIHGVTAHELMLFVQNHNNA